MRHRVREVTLDRAAGPRRALLRTGVEQVVLYEHLTTTLAKAKALQPKVERCISVAKRGTLQARRQLLQYLPTELGVKKMLEVLAPRYRDRRGGYTRIIKLGRRTGDASPMAQIQLVSDVKE